MTDARPRFRPPRQERSRGTLHAIERAADALAAERGLGGVTVQDVLDRSGVSTGSFYGRFAGRDALIQHLENAFWEELEEDWRSFLTPERWEGPEVTAVAGELVRCLFRCHAARAGRLRTFLVHALAHPGGKPFRRALLVDEGVARRMGALLATVAGHPALEERAARAARRLLSALRYSVLFPREPAGGPAGDREEILDLTAALLGTLSRAGAPGDYAGLLAASAALHRRRTGTAGPARARGDAAAPAAADRGEPISAAVT